MLDVESPPGIRWPRDIDTVIAELRALIAGGDLELPLPGGGDTAARWATLARLGRRDLALARLAEGHADALAIMAEAGSKPEPGALYGVWAARSAGTGAVLRRRILNGTVRFCSGARHLDRALIAALDEAGHSVVVDIDLTDDRVVPVPGTWLPLGMDASDSLDVALDDIEVSDDMTVGVPGFYLRRPGFWQGGIGVAAVWLGGAAGVLDDVTVGPSDPDPHQLAHVGAMYTTIRSTEALLVSAASTVDDAPAGDHKLLAWTCRSAAERTAWEVIERAPRVTGPAPMCRGRRFAQRLADLQVYVRQHHAEKDLAAIGREVWA